MIDPTLVTLLERTSRTFYLSLRVLPQATRGVVGLAYLLARAADTIADTQLLPADQRAALLAGFCPALRGQDREGHAAEVSAALGPAGGTPAERELLASLTAAYAAVDRLLPTDQSEVHALLEVVVAGMQLDLHWFSGPGLAALPTQADLERYTYHVAGVVGEFWTRVHARHLPGLSPRREAELMALAAPFGQGLQMVNILRDLPRDLQAGRCYLPLSALTPLGLEPADLLQSGAYLRVQPLYLRLLSRAEVLLRRGTAYAHRVPRRYLGVHLACRWPAELGLATIQRLRIAPDPLAPGSRIKLPRRAVYGLLSGAILRAFTA